ncbi:MAG: nucleotidyltransferase family protein [Thermomicrobiales bacterium]|nr:nucleotidyltransferase family protein [Thermomicrobiales bacterium]
MIVGIVLAAGSSSRLGRPKQLLPLAGEPLIRQTLRRILASSLDDLVVVVGHEAEAIAATLRDFPVRIVYNPDAAQGQSTSVLAGLGALPAGAEAALFLLGDQPGIDPAVIDALIAAWRESRAPIVAPRYTGGIGNPVLFDRRVFPELMSLQGDAGARPAVRAHREAGDLLLVPIAAPAPPDVDTEADYAALLTTFTS